jgi:biopolymer transport protein ExbB
MFVHSDFFTLSLAQAVDAPSPSSADINSVWDFVIKGGPVMIPIGICSLVALAVMIERLISLRRSHVIPRSFLPGLRSAFESSARNAMEFCKSRPSAVANVFAAGIRRLGEPVEVVERHVQEAGEREALKLRKNLRVLSVIGSTAPLLGLLGTITGMITAFQTVAASGEALGRTELLAKGIYEAMITTAAGLIVAIPVLICYHWLSAKIENLVMEIDRMTVDFIEQYARPTRAIPDVQSNGKADDHLHGASPRMPSSHGVSA